MRHQKWIQSTATQMISMTVKRMCFAKLLDDSKCDFNNERVIHTKSAYEEFEHNCFMKCELEETLFLK